MIKLNTAIRKIVVSLCVSIVASVLVFIVLQYKKQDNIAESIFTISQLPTTNISAEKYIISVFACKEIVAEVEKQFYSSGINRDNFRQHVSIATTASNQVKLLVSADNKEQAIELSELMLVLLNKKINSIVNKQVQTELQIIESEIAYVNHTLDTLKVATKQLNKDLQQNSGNHNTIEHNLLLLNDPDYISLTAEIKNFSNKLTNLQSSYNSLKNAEQNELQYIIQTAPTQIQPNSLFDMLKFVIVTALISFVAAICILVLFDKKKAA